MRRIVHAHRRIELATAGGGSDCRIRRRFRESVDKNKTRFDSKRCAVSLRAWHQSGLQTTELPRPFAFEFGAGGRGRQPDARTTISTAPADEHFRDFKGLFAAVGLRDKQVVDIDAEFTRIACVERVFGVDEAAAAEALRRRSRSERVVLPPDSGPKISMTRPRG
jgi:hypothetical protein